MAKLDYQRATPRRHSGGDVQFSELRLPLVLLVLGLVLYGIVAFTSAGARSALLVMGVVFIAAAVETVLGIGAAYITAIVLKTSFGELRSAFLKLAAILVLSGAIGALIPLGGLIALFVYFGLLMWLFGLEMYEAIIFAVIFTVHRRRNVDCDACVSRPGCHCHPASGKSLPLARVARIIFTCW